MTFAEDLTLAFRAGTPILLVETTEDERIDGAVRMVHRELGPRVLVWRSTAGLCERVDDDNDLLLQEAATPAALLELLVRPDAVPEDGRDVLVVAYDLVGEEALKAPELRLLKDLALVWEPTQDRPRRRTLLATGLGWTLPPALAGYVETRELELPRGDALAADFAGRRDRLAAVGLTPELLGGRAAGLSRLAVEQVYRRMHAVASSSTGGDPLVTQAAALAILDEIKREAIRRTHLLDILPLRERVELGGFAAFKAWTALRRDFLLQPGREGLRPRGVVLLGFPGCGKSHAARWIAQELGLPLVSMDLGRIQDRWVGSSEARLRLALRTLEAAAPLVLLVDEIEKAVAGVGTETTGVTTRLVGQLLTWLSDHRVPVFIVATANRPDLQPELTRAGRFDATFVVRLPSGEERVQICDAVSAALGVTLTDAARRALVEGTQDFSGAELRQVMIEAAYRAGFGRTLVGPEHVEPALGSATPLGRREEGRKLRERYEACLREGGYLDAGGGA